MLSSAPAGSEIRERQATNATCPRCALVALGERATNIDAVCDYEHQCDFLHTSHQTILGALNNMAGKEATVYIVDCGRTMGEHSHGHKESNLDWALQYVWDKITTTIATGRKTLLAGVVGLRTDASQNDLSSEEDYQHISIYRDLGQILMPHVRQLRNDLVVSNTDAGDAISSLVIAIQMITETCKKLQYSRKIVLVTDARGPMQADDLSQITDKLKEDSIELVVLGVDFDDAEYGFKEEGKDATKAENEEMLRKLCTDCNGVFGTLAQAIDELQIPRVKTTKPVPSYRGYLTLGNPETFDTALTIGVERYPKTMQAHPPTASKFVVRGDMATQSTQASSTTMANGEGAGGDGLAAVKSTRAYQIEDEEAAAGKREVEPDELSKGYEYGRTAVHISESDRNVTTYETSPCLDIIGFVEKAKYSRYLEMGRTNLIVPAKGDDKAAMALSSLIHALYELDSYAVARLVVKENKEPRIMILAPHIDPDLECFYDTELPFAEDIRSYKFPPLDRVLTVSGKVLKLHRNLPSDDLQDAMSAYVDSMDLSKHGKDDEGDDAEYAPIDETFSPMLHRIHQVTKHRAVYSDAEPPPPYDILTKYAHPPGDLVAQSQKPLDAVIAAAQVKKVPPKARGRKFGRKNNGRDAEKPLSDLDVNALLSQDPGRQKKRIDAKNAIPEFKQILAASEDLDEVRDACAQLQRILFDWIKYSVGDSGYGRAIEAIRVMREEVLEMEVPAVYNEMLGELKKRLLEGALGGERREMWWKVRMNRLKPISKAETEVSELTEEAAREMMSGKL